MSASVDTSAWDAAWARYEHLHAVFGGCDSRLMGKAAHQAVEAAYIETFVAMRNTPAPTAEALARKIIEEASDLCPELAAEAQAILDGNHPLSGGRACALANESAT